MFRPLKSAEREARRAVALKGRKKGCDEEKQPRIGSGAEMKMRGRSETVEGDACRE